MEKYLTKPQKAKPAEQVPPDRKRHPSVLKETSLGVVDFCVKRYSDNLSARNYSPARLLQKLKAGLPYQELELLRLRLDLPVERLLPVLGVSKATLHRRKLAGKLDAAESDRVIRFARLLGKATHVMESLQNARKWLSAPQAGLGGAVPLDYADTETGAREVEDLLGRMEYGVYS